MRKLKDVLRLNYEAKLSQANINKVTQVARSTIQEYIRRFEVSGLSWPLPQEMTNSDLEKKLYSGDRKAVGKRAPIDCVYIYQELKKPNVTLEVLWSEYKQANPDGYHYSHFCNLYRGYKNDVAPSMRQEHKAGEKCFVDFGEGLFLVDPLTGEKQQTKLFVSVWGASQYTFAKATLSENLASWIAVNVAALEYFECCPKANVPDNLKSAVSKACRYEPDLNPTYADFARHYGLVILPARPYHPKDKALAETGVKLAKRWILARLRNRIFTSLAEMNQAIAELLGLFNQRIMRKLNKSRAELFATLDKPNALRLPDSAYEFAEFKKAKVNINYHINFDKHDYSIPYTLIGKTIEVRATASIIEILYDGARVCSHKRSYKPYHYTTNAEHMPTKHQKYLEWTPERIMAWAEKYGPEVKELIHKVMSRKMHPEQNFKSCLGIIRLEKRYNAVKLNAACQRALEYKVYTYQGINDILAKNLMAPTTNQTPAKSIRHQNIRGSSYYGQEFNNAVEQLISNN